MAVTTIVAVALATLVAGAVLDRGSDNPKFKADKHTEWNDPSKADR